MKKIVKNMEASWIECLLLGFLLIYHSTLAQSDVEVHLNVKKYNEENSTVPFVCEHNIQHKSLYKVTWIREKFGKIFEFVNGRNPPYLILPTPNGTEIDWALSNESQVVFKNANYSLEGTYYCEVSTNTPIYFKESKSVDVHIMIPQQAPPRVLLNGKKYTVGQQLVANCTTTKSRPPAHITWIINGEKVDQKYVRTIHRNVAMNETAHHHHRNHNRINDKSDYVEPTSYRVSTPSHHNELVAVNEHNTHYSRSANVYGTETSEINYHLPNTNDNKFRDLRKHGKFYHKKFRRHVHDPTKPTISLSQLKIVVEEEHKGKNGKLEITCLATIPNHLQGFDEQYADFKTHSVWVDVTDGEASTTPKQTGMANALGNSPPMQLVGNLAISILAIGIRVFVNEFITLFHINY